MDQHSHRHFAQKIDEQITAQQGSLLWFKKKFTLALKFFMSNISKPQLKKIFMTDSLPYNTIFHRVADL